MRSRWEDSGNVLDEPASITERELRSLRRGARAGKLAILLAFASAGAAAWSLLMGPDALAGIEGVQRVKLKVLSAIGQPAPVENPGVAPATPQPNAAQGPSGTQAASTPDSTTTQVTAPNSR